MKNAGTILNNRYRLAQKVGEGGYAQVYRATDLMLGRDVAVKITDADLHDSQDSLRRFQIEARAIAALDHPNILPVYDFGLLSESAYLVMPFVPGGTLMSRLKQGQFSPQEACSYLEQIASALDYAHANQIIHRDVKPSNILLRKDGRPMLADFGFAKIMPDAQVEASTQALGTVQYVAPEQIHGRVSAFTDQYALGVVFYQLLSGVVPFSGPPQTIMMAHLTQFAPSLATQPGLDEVNPTVVERLDQVVWRALAKVATDRFPSCLDFAQACWWAVQPNQKPSMPFPLPVPPAPWVATSVPAILAPPPASPVASSNEQGATEMYSGLAARPAPVRPQPARLEIYTRPDQGLNLVFDLHDEVITLGRDSQMNLQVPLATVSRHQATLHRIATASGPRYRIVDNHSRNGLSFQGKFINERLLADGDVIEIGRPGYGDYVVFLTYTAALAG